MSILLFSVQPKEENNEPETFGFYQKSERMERGWLTSETIVQIKLFNNPIELWKPKLKNKMVSRIRLVFLQSFVLTINNQLTINKWRRQKLEVYLIYGHNRLCGCECTDSMVTPEGYRLCAVLLMVSHY